MAAPPIPPLGGTPLSAYQADSSGAIRGPALLSDNIDPMTGEYKDLLTAPHPVDAAVLTAFQVIFEAGPGLGRAGHKFFEIKKGDAQAQQRIRNEAARLMKPFEDRGWIVLHEVRGEVIPPDNGAALVTYTNVLTGRRGSLRFPDGTFTTLETQ